MPYRAKVPAIPPAETSAKDFRVEELSYLRLKLI
jgi:hypothetical protein